jgi:hypothetical protein
LYVDILFLSQEYNMSSIFTRRTRPQRPQPVQQATDPDDLWRSGRPRFGLQNFRRGRDKRFHFPGQQDDEVVKLIIRQHWVFLLTPALPAIGAFCVLVILLMASTRFPSVRLPWGLFEFIDVVVMFILLVWLGWRDLLEWYLNVYIITNKRIISSRGVLEPTRESTPLSSMRQVGIDLTNLWQFMLRYGTVHIYLVGGDMIMHGVPHPKRIKEVLDNINQGIVAAQPKEAEIPMPAIPAVAAAIDELAEPKPLPKLENADDRYPPPRHPERRIGPRRTFGGILRIPSEVRYTSGEQTVRYIQRSRYVLYRNLIIPIILLLAALPVAIYVPSSGVVPGTEMGGWFFISGLVVLILLIVILATYVNWVDDVIILTNRRIIDIDRKFIFFYEMRAEIDYKNIRDIRVKVPNPLQRLLDIGDLKVEVAGTPGITFPTIDHPFFVMDKIYDLQKYKEKADSIKKVNEQKKELKTWFGTVITTLVQTTQMNGAPNLYHLDFIEAMERANELGFTVNVFGEEIAEPGIASGVVIYQNPPAGTVMNPGTEIEVVLSK